MTDDNKEILGISQIDQQNPAIPDSSRLPSSPAEVRIAAIWQSALSGIPVNRDDHFIVIGGDSFSLAQVIMEIEQAYGITIPVEVIADNLTLASMAATVDRLTGQASKSSSAE